MDFQELNRLRRRTIMNLFLYAVILFFVAIILLINFGSVSENAFIFIIIGAGALFFIGKPLIVKKYRSTFKTKVVPIALKELGDNLEYSEEGFSKSEVLDTDMFRNVTVYSSEDTIKGQILDVNFRCADVKMGYYVGSGKNRRYVRVCHGQFYIFDFNKRFRSTTHIREKDGIFDNVGNPRGLSKIKLESGKFNDLFKIYTSNEHDAFYILTPHFMEKIMLLERRHPGRLFIGFINNSLYIGIDNNRDLFEPPLLSPIDSSIISEQVEDIQAIRQIIEELKINVKIFVD